MRPSCPELWQYSQTPTSVAFKSAYRPGVTYLRNADELGSPPRTGGFPCGKEASAGGAPDDVGLRGSPEISVGGFAGAYS